MGNIMDYLDWRGDITFEQSPFNEVDNVILAQLAYVNFRDIIPSTGCMILAIRYFPFYLNTIKYKILSKHILNIGINLCYSIYSSHRSSFLISLLCSLIQQKVIIQALQEHH